MLKQRMPCTHWPAGLFGIAAMLGAVVFVLPKLPAAPPPAGAPLTEPGFLGPPAKPDGRPPPSPLASPLAQAKENSPRDRTNHAPVIRMTHQPRDPALPS